MRRERNRGVPHRTSTGWIVAAVGALITLGVAALWSVTGSDPVLRRALAPAPEIPEVHVQAPPKLAAARRELGAPAEALVRPPRERAPVLLKDVPTKSSLPKEKRVAPKVAPLPPVDARPDLPAVRPRVERSLGAESLISSDFGDGTLVVMPTRKQQLAALLEPAEKAATPGPETPVVTPEPTLSLPGPAANRPEQAPAPARVAERPAPRPKPSAAATPVVSTFEPRPQPLAFAPPDLEHIDIGKADLLERLPKLKPVADAPEKVLTLQPVDVVSNHPPPVTVPWLDPPDTFAVHEPMPHVSDHPALELLKPFRDQMRRARRVLDIVSFRATPEPGTGALLALGLTWLALRRRR